MIERLNALPVEYFAQLIDTQDLSQVILFYINLIVVVKVFLILRYLVALNVLELSEMFEDDAFGFSLRLCT